MAKTKWIVPGVAMLLCAVSLIGAGYAAYTATLADTENVTVENDYTILKIGSNAVNNKAFIEYNSASTSTGGATPTTTYTGIATEQTLVTFTVDYTQNGTVDNTHAITYTSITNTSTGDIGNYFGSITFKVVKVSDSSVVAPGETLLKDTQYNVVLVLANPTANVATAPAAAGYSVSYTINISDNVTHTDA